MLRLLTAASNSFAPLAAVTTPGKLQYALRHGYEFISRIHSDTVGKDGEPWGERQRFMLNAMADLSPQDWIWFTGADLIITNYALPIGNLCRDDMDFVFCNDVNGFNNDSFLLRASPAAFDFMRKTLSYRFTLPHDQVGMAVASHAVPSLRTLQVPQRVMNSYLEAEYGRDSEGNWQPGDLALHFPAMTLHRRIELAIEYSAKAVE